MSIPQIREPFPLMGHTFRLMRIEPLTSCGKEKRVSTILYTPLYNNARDKVFADDESTQSPIVVPRNWLSDSTRKNRYCGTSPTTIFKGFTLYHIQHALCKEDFFVIKVST
ncbi:hypothetical protein OROMI_009697 [Orobanche minor]